MTFRVTRTRLIGIPFAMMAIGSWLPVLVMWAQDIGWSGAVGRGVAIWYAFPALIAVLIMQGPILKQPVLEPLGLRLSVNRWWAVAWFLPVAALLVGLLVTKFAGYEPVLTIAQLIENKRSMVPIEHLPEFEAYLAENQPPHPWMLIVLGMPAGLTFNLLLALCDEVAFRGYFFREVQGGFWARATTIGLLWWVWLAPSIALGNFYGVPGLESVLLALPWCIVTSWVLVYLRVRSGSVIATALARGTILALTAAALDLTFGAPYWLQPFYGVAGLIGIATVWCAFLVHDRTREEGRLTAT
ncbi:MAG: CPBP family glutamic-type intramembrane protease [Polyangiales bacterium]